MDLPRRNVRDADAEGVHVTLLAEAVPYTGFVARIRLAPRLRHDPPRP